MAAGGFKEFVAGEVLDEDEINDFLMQGVLVFAGTAARGSAITSPVEGQFAFLKDTDALTFYDGSQWTELSTIPPRFDFLVIAGGGAGAGQSGTNTYGGGGGAGGYRSSVVGELSGGSAVAESALFLAPGTVTVTVGAGAAGVSGFNTSPNVASNSEFASIISVGGGFGGGYYISNGQGGSAGGGGVAEQAIQRTPLGGIPKMGRNGGSPSGGPGSTAGGGGGGAQNVGATAVTTTGGNGGSGISSSINGSPVTRGGGGGGGATTTAGTGGAGGGGNGGAVNANGSPGTANTGGGGGGAARQGAGDSAGGNGGSGVVIIKYPDTITLTIDPGLTSSTSTAGGFKTTTFTAGTGPVVIP